MKVIGLNVGDNVIKYPSYASFKAGKVVFAEVYANVNTTVTITRGLDSTELTSTSQVASVSVSNGYGGSTVSDIMLSYGDKVTVSASPAITGGCVARLFVQD